MADEALVEHEDGPTDLADDGLVVARITQGKRACEYDELDILQAVCESGRDETDEVLVSAIVAGPAEDICGSPGAVDGSVDRSHAHKQQYSKGNVCES